MGGWALLRQVCWVVVGEGVGWLSERGVKHLFEPSDDVLKPLGHLGRFDAGGTTVHEVAPPGPQGRLGRKAGHPFGTSPLFFFMIFFSIPTRSWMKVMRKWERFFFGRMRSCVWESVLPHVSPLAPAAEANFNTTHRSNLSEKLKLIIIRFLSCSKSVVEDGDDIGGGGDGFGRLITI